ncbi:MAG TPA: peptidase M16 [Cyanobacteria bacterium UBA11149]|nr:peptidase M16 [Cyanobacteria bacterium UBA11367]HBE57276.1 peptidase M16 [Cyanobacteria bacterium UBA11366]HBK64513.1 peptidase M16 [Cyanobacteria bacterium UBA11166]HBR76456.1 peptidase M16 [Cyanobacteria bacterium UBA11159]HBS71694.1 peptidase M16 [Cyanobacteria bacterium UBA11153]HBW91026.1 peptidase M16 [Cyanobacteria bacterium UBA11149]HCA96510.1 peptidase M16 [Cyanobacteria bacterium UBA9226]
MVWSNFSTQCQRYLWQGWKWGKRLAIGLPQSLLLMVIAIAFWINLPSIALARTDTPATTSIQPYLERVIQQITQFRLDNGLQFIVLERHEAPVISFVTYTDVGGADEPEGKTGIAHFLEHLAFKGTTIIGTKDYQAEKPLLDKLDRLSGQIKAATQSQNQTEAAKLQAEFTQVEAQAAQLVNQNEFGQIVQQAGGVGLNAQTSADATIYFYSFPSNKLELWMSLESERFLDPVFREFYKEQQVILEERRMRTDNSPIGKTIEAFLDKAFQIHPYRRPVIGYDKDIRNLTRADVQEFFETHYVPSKITIAIVGDINPTEVKKLAEIYFGRYPAKPTPPEINIIEPPQTETKEITLKLPSQPWYLEGYHRPSINDPDRVVYDTIASLLSDGRTSRLYKSLVQEKQIALSATGASGFPGDKHPNLILLYALTAPGHTVEELATVLHSEIERLKTEPISKEELDRVKTQSRAALLRALDSNMGMARNLVEYQVKTGDWRNLFNELEAINAVTPADIQRVAQATFTPENRTIGRILPE